MTVEETEMVLEPSSVTGGFMQGKLLLKRGMYTSKKITILLEITV